MCPFNRINRLDKIIHINKGFYKRSIDKHHKYVCYFGSKCSVTSRHRRRCKLCRWKQCIQAGMSFDSIKMGRISKAEKEKVSSYLYCMINISHHVLLPSSIIQLNKAE